MASTSKDVYLVKFKGVNPTGPKDDLMIRASNPTVAINEAKRVLKNPRWDGFGRPYKITDVTFEGTLDN